MALGTPTNLVTGSDTDASVTTASFSVSTGSVVLITAVCALAGGFTPTDGWSISLTHSGAGTPTKIGGVVYGARRALTAYYVTGATGSGTVTATYTGNSSANAAQIFVAVNEITGADGTTPVSGAGTDSGNDSATPTTGTADTGDYVVGCFGYEAASGGTCPGTQEPSVLSDASNVRQFFNFYDDSASPDTTPAFSGSGGNGVGGIAWVVEVGAASGQTSSPTKGSITFTGQTPTASVTANKTVEPTKGSIVLTGFAPTATVGVDQTSAPSKGSIVLTGRTPTTSVTLNKFTEPSKGAIVLTGFAPTATKTENQTVEPSKGQITFTGFAPTSLTGLVSAPTKGEITITGLTPSVAQTTNVFKEPSPGSIVFTGYAPTVSGGTAAVATAVIPAGVGKGKYKKRKLYRLPDGRLVYATYEELQRLLEYYSVDEDEVEQEIKSYPKNSRRKQVKKLRAKAIDAPLIISELEEDMDIQYVVKEVARFLSE